MLPTEWITVHEQRKTVLIHSYSIDEFSDCSNTFLDGISNFIIILTMNSWPTNFLKDFYCNYNDRDSFRMCWCLWRKSSINRNRHRVISEGDKIFMRNIICLFHKGIFGYWTEFISNMCITSIESTNPMITRLKKIDYNLENDLIWTKCLCENGLIWWSMMMN